MGTALGVLATNILGSRQTERVESGETASRPAEESQPARVAPNFRFQEILSDDQVDIDSKPPPPPPPAPRPTPPSEPPKTAEQPVAKPQTPAPTPPVETVAPRKGGYILQVGSLSREADAERLKAQLALLGISTNIQTVTLSSGRTTHRVRTGAYANKQEMEKVRALLKANGKDSLAISIK
ncbi:hypothetical protein, putative FtsN cell division protein [Imhoffiella purpurea]|uniref:SPOR domain-containing protein n=2 Tax=Imhoffiella purpurea TaxID=1249627 RepID=W9VBE2_9GAMM|nr:hypothetical protein, putative FtsN cell division protein [Imhoffiella purpurea]